MPAQASDLQSSALVVQWFIGMVGLHTSVEVGISVVGGLVDAGLIGLELIEEVIEISVVGCVIVGLARHLNKLQRG